jgi:hypothetical protein
VYLPRNHGCFFDFYQDLRDAIFDIDVDDLATVHDVLRKQYPGIDLDKYVRSNFSWVRKHVRRRVRGRRDLHRRLKGLFERYQDVRDGDRVDGKKFFNKAAKIARRPRKFCSMRRRTAWMTCLTRLFIS